jgi:hypothetical protein
VHISKCFGFFAGLLLAVSAAAQLNVSYHATQTLDVSYYAGDPEESDPANLSISTTSTPPSSLNYNGATGTFVFEFLAPEGFRFVVNPLDGPVGIGFQIAYTNYNSGGASGGLSAFGTQEIALLGVVGTAPTLYLNATLTDYPHAYLSVGFNTGGITETLSFRGFRYSVNFLGTGNDILNPHYEGGNLSVYDNDYTGAAPGAHLELLTIAAIPEPGTSAALVGGVVLVVCGWVRREGTKRKDPDLTGDR